MSETVVIKRYSNRKLYDTSRSCYVTLQDVAQMVRRGDDVQVIDNHTKEDITSLTMAQVLVEEEKRSSGMPIGYFRELVRNGQHALGEFVQKKMADPVMELRQDAEKRIEQLWKRSGNEHGLHTVSTDVKNEETGNVVEGLVTATMESIEHWQKRVDERVRDTLGRMGYPRPDALEALEKRIEELEQRLEKIQK